MSTTLSIRISEELLAKLDRLAAATQRSKSFLAVEAISSYVAHELPIVEGIAKALADIDAGNWVSHEEVMREMDEIIKAAAAKHKVKA